MKTCPIPRLLNQRTDDSHYHWTKKWGAGHSVPVFLLVPVFLPPFFFPIFAMSPFFFPQIEPGKGGTQQVMGRFVPPLQGSVGGRSPRSRGDELIAWTPQIKGN